MGLGGGEGLGGGGLMAAAAANRMRSRQQYRTMSRMQRRRSAIADRAGVRGDFERPGEQQPAPAEPAAPAPAAQDYTAELEKLAGLRDKGVIMPEDFEAKKNQLLGL
ncbi:MAG TPA: SHOCT domain-containing protein [Solirubrobacterales bacterium]|nr:SHOCT domain-containing protein [Solirubrobacterales bacterium]